MSSRFPCVRAATFDAVIVTFLRFSNPPKLPSPETAWPRSSAGPSGSELSHPQPRRARARAYVRYGHLAKRPEPVAQLGGVQLRLLPGSEVPAPLDLVEMDEVGIRLLRPAPRHLEELVGEDAHGHRDGHVP